MGNINLNFSLPFYPKTVAKKEKINENLEHIDSNS